MPRGSKPGEKRGGRKKGTVNKDTVPVREKALELGIDPFEVLLRFAAGDWKALGYADYGRLEKYTIDPSIRAKAAAEACQFLHPKLKAIEHKAPQGELVRVKIYETEWGSTHEPETPASENDP